MGLISHSSEIEALAATDEDSGGVYFVPAYSGLFAPYWRSDARGVIVGLTRFANKGHLARAVLDASAYQTKDIVEAMNRDSGVELSALKVDGGMVYNEMLMQFIADMLGVPVIRPRITETTALGAAYAAGLAVGFWSGLDALRQHWSEEKRWLPVVEHAYREEQYRGWKKAVERTLGWVDG
jgi:glycerol kinase